MSARHPQDPHTGQFIPANHEPNCRCAICDTPFFRIEAHQQRVTHPQLVYCSTTCAAIGRQVNLTGETFGWLTVIALDQTKTQSRHMALFVCLWKDRDCQHETAPRGKDEKLADA